MAQIFTGGQALPAVGTAAYTAAQNASTTTTANGTKINVPNLPAVLAPSNPSSNVQGQNIGSGYAYNQATNTFNTPLNSSGTQMASYNPNGSQASIPSPYAVITSKDAQDHLQNVNDFYTNTTAGMQSQAQTNAQTAATSAQVPVISGYNVTSAKTGNPGEISVQQNGQTYYATPATPPNTMPTSDEVWSALNNSNGGSITPPTAPTPPQNVNVPNPSGIDINAENAGYESALGQTANNIQGAYNTYNQAVQSMINGTFPLTGAQQTLINSTSNAFDSLINNAQLKASALSSETGGVSNKITGMMGDFQNIQTAKSAAISNMEIGFQNQDFDMITKAYDAFTSSEQAQTGLITDMHNTVVSAYQTAVQNYMAQQQFQATQAQQQFTDQMSSANFNLTEAQDANDNMFKQEQITEQQYKDNQDIINQKTTAAIAAYNAGLIPGGTFNPSTGTFTTADGTQGTSPTQLPGYTTTSNGAGLVQHPNGDTYFVNGDGSLTKFQSAGDAINFQKDGTAASTLNQMQVLYNQRTLGVLNLNAAVQYENLYKTLPTNLQGLVPGIGMLSGGLLSGSISGTDKFSTAFNTVNQDMKTTMPSYSPPQFGTIFPDKNSAGAYLKSTGQESVYTNLQKQGYNDDQILQIINGQ